MSSVHPGDVLAGKYRVERVLGSGGMGYVVAARHLQLDQLVAMKFLRRGGNALDETEATGRFLREAKAVVRLRDEHVAKVFDVGTLETGEPYIVMEYLDGCDLAALSKQRGSIPVPEVVEYVMQACEALAEAHSLGIVHRDVKLANLFLTRGHAGSPLVKVLDFGISKVNPFGESDHEMTRTASMLGSPRFMSPEQMRDPRGVDARSDIWSLGVVLYRLVSGRPPFEAETLGRLLTMVMHENPDSLTSLLPGALPPGFSETVQHCLEKEPSQRFSNIAELAYALSAFAADPARARNVADRIAATLSVAQIPLSHSSPSFLGVPSSLMSQSNPPGASDTGTAAPWAGTHGGGARPTSVRTGLTLAAAALVATLGAGALFAKVHRDRSVDARAGAAMLPATAVTAASVDGDLGGAATTTPPAARTSVAVAALPSAAPESDPAGGAARAASEERRRPGSSPAGARRTPRPAAPIAATAAAAAPPAVATAQSGIPSTRD